MPRTTGRRIACVFYSWNLFQRDGVYYADGRSNTPNTGKHSLGTKGHVEALENLKKLDRYVATKMGKAEAELPDPVAGLSIAEGWKRYEAHSSRPQVLGGVGVTTQKRYRAVKDKHLKFCLARRIVDWSQITRKNVEEYCRWLTEQGYKAATVYLECTLLKQVVKWLIEEEKALPESSRVRLTVRRSHESDTYCYTREQVTAMINHCDGTDLKWLRFLILVLARTGMRIGEALQLRWSDVDLVAGVITLQDNRHSGKSTARAARTTKGRRGRRIPIHKSLKEVLEAAGSSTAGPVFVGPRGGRLKSDDVRVALINKVLIPMKSQFPPVDGEPGFQDGRIHSFRHFFVSQAFVSGTSEGEIREWVGHSSSRIVERYRHLNSQDARRKMDRIEFLEIESADASGHTTEGGTDPLPQ